MLWFNVAPARGINVDLCITPLGGFIVNSGVIGSGIGSGKVKVKGFG